MEAIRSTQVMGNPGERSCAMDVMSRYPAPSFTGFQLEFADLRHEQFGARGMIRL
jgi:hypothetical protein